MAIDRRVEDLLYQAARALSSELSLPRLLQQIVHLAKDVSGARYAALGIIGKDGGISQFVYEGITDEQRQKIGDLPRGRGILGALISDQKPLRLTRLQDDPRSVGFPRHHPSMTTFLGVPVMIKGKAFGNLYLTEKGTGGPFTEDDEKAVITLAAHAGVAVENARLFEEAALGQKRLEAVNEIFEQLLAGQGLDDVLIRIARRAREMIDADLATVAVPESDDVMIIRVADGAYAAELSGLTFPTNDSVSGGVMQTVRPLIIADASSDPRVHQPMVAIGRIGPAMFVPLAAGQRAVGTLSVANAVGGSGFSDDDLGVVQTFAAQASVALEYVRIRDELSRFALIEDRERIAKELHDGVIQSLFAVGMSLQAVEMLAEDPVEVRQRVATAVGSIDEAIRDLRNYIFGLRPGMLADRKLEEAMNDLASQFRESEDLKIEVAMDPTVASLLAGKASELLQMTREMLSNAVRHSGGSTVSLSVFRMGKVAYLQVRDDGKGFDLEGSVGLGHGLTNLSDRAARLGASFTVRSEQGRGSIAEVALPL